MNRHPHRVTYASICSGIEAVTAAWHPLGMKPVWFAEIDPFACAVLAHHYPHVPNQGDMTHLASLVLKGAIPTAEVLVGGTPCQSFSISGLRQGLNDPRGALTLSYVELANAFDTIRKQEEKPASIIVWENVPGVLSDRTNAFGCLLSALAGECHVLRPPCKSWSDAGVVLGPQRTIAWRVLDAQYFGVPQRRRRVILIASAREGFDPTEVLFERTSLCRDLAAVSPQQKTVAGTLTTRNAGGDLTCLQPVLTPYCLAHGQGNAEVLVDGSPTLTCNHEAPILVHAAAVRRLMPVECEAIQGFERGYTRIPWRNKPALACPDAPRYRVLGNSMAVPCIAWVGQRLLWVLRESGVERHGLSR
ncbi:DNA cytosine methyltransferase [Pseudomonas huaxiensis]|uniref:DNA cytosine methyltransferase n=1 Tax=Pseudomonas huaxiensis TaxID=2213017 RepID=UPI000DA69D20|nr:DNA cytosine methyltransferase [Pseudomonas huaxiensis]